MLNLQHEHGLRRQSNLEIPVRLELGALACSRLERMGLLGIEIAERKMYLAGGVARGRSADGRDGLAVELVVGALKCVAKQPELCGSDGLGRTNRGVPPGFSVTNHPPRVYTPAWSLAPTTPLEEAR